MPWKPDYITATDVADYLRVGDTVDNAEFGMWATAASRAIDTRCNRQFGQLATATARTYRRRPYYVHGTGLWHVDIDDLQDTTGLLVGGVDYADSEAVLLPETAPDEGKPWTALGLVSDPAWPFTGFPAWSLVVTAKWGWTAVPAQVIAACKLQVSRWSARRDSPYGIAGSPEQGSELRLLARLDPDVVTTLAGLLRPRRAA